MSPTTKTNAFEQLAELDQAVLDAEYSMQEQDFAEEIARAEPARLEQALRRYFDDVHAGRRDEDDDEQNRLEAALGQARNRLTTDARTGQVTLLEAQSKKAAIARDVHQPAVVARLQFIESHRDELAGELLERARVARERVRKQVEQLQGALAASDDVAGAWTPLLNVWNPAGSWVGDMPGSASSTFIAPKVEIPAPRSLALALLEADEQAARRSHNAYGIPAQVAPQDDPHLVQNARKRGLTE